MRRCLFTLLAVAFLATWISQFELANGRGVARPTWVRTVDGWEQRGVVDVRGSRLTPILHPVLFAGVQACSALIALAAFPGRTRPVTRPLPAPAVFRSRTGGVRHRKKRPAAIG